MSLRIFGLSSIPIVFDASRTTAIFNPLADTPTETDGDANINADEDADIDADIKSASASDKSSEGKHWTSHHAGWLERRKKSGPP